MSSPGLTLAEEREREISGPRYLLSLSFFTTPWRAGLFFTTDMLARKTRRRRRRQATPKACQHTCCPHSASPSVRSVRWLLLLAAFEAAQQKRNSPGYVLYSTYGKGEKRVRAQTTHQCLSSSRPEIARSSERTGRRWSLEFGSRKRNNPRRLHRRKGPLRSSSTP